MDPFDPDGLFIVPIERKRPEIYGKTQKAIELVVNHGLTPSDALCLATGKQQIDSGTLSRFRAKVQKHSLARPAMVKLAHSVVQDVLRGKADSVTTQKLGKNGQVVDIIEQIAPTHTNKLAAAAMVFDRAEPVVRQNVNLNGDLKDFMPVNLDDFR
jgi:hypothetical protein